MHPGTKQPSISMVLYWYFFDNQILAPYFFKHF